MDEFSDVGMMFDLSKQNDDELSQVERLLNEFEAHEQKEQQTIEQYKGALAQLQNPVTRLVMQMILSDEEKHRAMTHSMASTLKGSLTWTKPAGSLDTGSADTKIKRELLAMTEAFIELEKSGIREYKLLLKESADYYHGLFGVLLNAMIRDSEKHAELLEFIRQRVSDYE